MQARIQHSTAQYNAAAPRCPGGWPAPVQRCALSWAAVALAGADATAHLRLHRDVGREQLGRILLKRSMLRDHLLSHYAAALERLLGDGPGDAALASTQV